MRPVTLLQLNQFLVLNVTFQRDQALITGRLSKPGERSQGDDVSLFIGLDENLSGELTEMNPGIGTVVLTTAIKDLQQAVQPGASFPVYGSYWTHRIRLALDPRLIWTGVHFVPPDAFEQPSPQGGRMWRAVEPGDENRTDGRIVPGGWDHEHCELCWQHIDRDNPEAFVSANKDWVCVRCFRQFIEPHDLGFLMSRPDDADS